MRFRQILRGFAAIALGFSGISQAQMAPQSEVFLSSERYAASPQSQTVQVQVLRRVVEGAGPAQVFYRTGDGSAIAGVHYEQATGDLQWDEDDFAPKVVSIPLINRGQILQNLDLTFELFSANGDTLGVPSFAFIEILGVNEVGAGELRFSGPSLTAGQDQTSASIDVVRVKGSVGPATVRVRTVNNDGRSNPVDQIITFANNDTVPKSVTVTGVAPQEDRAEPVTVRLELSEAQGATLGQPQTVDLVFPAADEVVAPPQAALFFSSSNYVAGITQNSVTVDVLRRASGQNDGAQVRYRLSNLTAEKGVHYADVSGSLLWNAGDFTAKQIQIPLINRSQIAQTLSFRVEILDAAGDAIGSPSEAVVEILGVDEVSPGSVRFSLPSLSVGMDQTSATIDVVRVNGSKGSARVRVRTVDSVGIATPIDRNINFADGDVAPKQVIVSGVPPQAERSAPVTVDLELSDPQGVTISEPSRISITFPASEQDPEQAPANNIGFADPERLIPAGVSQMVALVQRDLTSDFAARVNYRIIEITARAGLDYSPLSASGFVEFVPGETGFKPISIQLIPDELADEDRQFRIELTSTSNELDAMRSSQLVTLQKSPDAQDPPSAGNIRFLGTGIMLSQPQPLLIQIPVIRDGTPPFAQASVNYFANADLGTARPGVDYSSITGTLSWNAGESSIKLIEVLLNAPTQPVDARTIVIQMQGPALAEPQTYVITLPAFEPSQASGTGSVRVDVSEQRIAPGVTIATLFALREGVPPLSPLAVSFRTVAGSAIQDLDYRATAGQVSWGENDTTPKQIQVQILRSTTEERSFSVQLSGQGVNPAQSSTSLVLEAQEVAPPIAAGTGRFTAEARIIPPELTEFTMTVQRVGGVGPLTMSYFASSDGFATQGAAVENLDYQLPAQQTVSWQDGDYSPKLILVQRPVVSDVADKAFRLHLLNQDGTEVVSGGEAIITLVRNTPDQVNPTVPSFVGFTRASDKVGTESGSYLIQIARQGNLAGPASVTINGPDGFQRDINWISGDGAVKVVAFDLPETAFEENQTAVFTLTTQSLNVQLAGPTSFVLTIQNGSGGGGGTGLAVLLALFGLAIGRIASRRFA